jgi:hypothetical protein
MIWREDGKGLYGASWLHQPPPGFSSWYSGKVKEKYGTPEIILALLLLLINIGFVYANNLVALV